MPKQLNGYIIASLVLAVIFLTADRFLDFEVSLEEESYDDRKSIAVLPFENMSGDEEAYFSLGITEDIRTQISNIGDLRVLSRFTLKEYNSAGKSPREIGEELGVSNLLVGSIRKRGDQLRISCQIIETSDESEIWGRTFDRTLDDIFKIQSEIAIEIANNLKTRLTPLEEKRNKTSSTQNIAAYNIYLRGRGIYDIYTPENNEKAITLFKEALRLDPNYGLAMAGLADAYCQGVARYGNRTSDFLDSARAIAEKASILHPEITEVWKALALVSSAEGNDAESKEHLKKALSINPNHLESINNYGVLLQDEGELAEANKFLKRSAHLGPLTSQPFWALTNNYMTLDLYNESRLYMDRALELFNDSIDVFNAKSIKEYMLNDNKESSKKWIYKMAEYEPNNPSTIAGVAGGFTAFFDPELARPYLEKVVKMVDYNPEWQTSVPINIAFLLIRDGKSLDSARMLVNKQIDYAMQEIEEGNEGYYWTVFHGNSVLGNKDEALSTMEKLIQIGAVDYKYFLMDNRLASIRNEPKFQEMIAEMKEKIAVMRRQVIEDDAAGQMYELDL
jgi:TolB-like protein